MATILYIGGKKKRNSFPHTHSYTLSRFSFFA